MIKTSTLLLALLPSLGWGFVPHSHLSLPLPTVTSSTTTTTARNMFWLADNMDMDGIVSSAQDAVTAAATDAIVTTSGAAEDVLAITTPSDGGGILDTVKNIALGLTAVVFLLAGVTYVTAAVLIPAAAKELEEECKDLAPDLWTQYQAKLEPGQTIDQRPDLMQEIGAKLQPLLDAKMEQQFAQKKEQGIDVTKDEEAWKALDGIKVPTGDSFKSSVSPPQRTEDTTAPTLTTDQWDDDDAGSSSNVIVDAEVVEKKKD